MPKFNVAGLVNPRARLLFTFSLSHQDKGEGQSKTRLYHVSLDTVEYVALEKGAAVGSCIVKPEWSKSDLPPGWYITKHGLIMFTTPKDEATARARAESAALIVLQKVGRAFVTRGQLGMVAAQTEQRNRTALHVAALASLAPIGAHPENVVRDGLTQSLSFIFPNAPAPEGAEAIVMEYCRSVHGMKYCEADATTARSMITVQMWDE